MKFKSKKRERKDNSNEDDIGMNDVTGNNNINANIDDDDNNIAGPSKAGKRAPGASAATAVRPSNENDDDDDFEGMGEFEDDWVDEEEGDDEGEVIIDNNDEEEDIDEGMEVDAAANDKLKGPARISQVEEEDDEANLQVYLPGQKLAEGEELVADQSVYEMLHQMHVEWPCLSFDILRDNLGVGRKTFPMTCYLVAGSQAETAKDNKIYIMKLSDLHRTKHDNDDEMDDSDNDDLDDDPILEHRTIPHNGGVNRVRTMPTSTSSTFTNSSFAATSHIVATWSDVGKVYIWDLSEHVAALDTPGLIPNKNLKPMFTVDRHNKVEGFAMDWSSLNNKYRLLTGDLDGKIYLTAHSQAGFVTDAQPFRGHQSSIEDLQWSPGEESVFASCSADKTVRIWDVRTKNKAQISYTAHDSDVNVISWNRLTDYLIASGSDSGTVSIWDLRKIASNQGATTHEPPATFRWHQAPITSIEWHPFESSMLCVAGADDQITLWDLALERDEGEEATVTTMVRRKQNEESGEEVMVEEKVEVPAQLLFVHQGQKDVKEIHWHRQCPGVIVSTALSGFNIFKTINS